MQKRRSELSLKLRTKRQTYKRFNAFKQKHEKKKRKGKSSIESGHMNVESTRGEIESPWMLQRKEFFKSFIHSQ